ncbi:transcription repressor OFP14 [Abrus precatorius]|uniref:Transcription repressor n=1 Tax=Abrus precatorius TaxID=3816 RepID=A0A8B8KJJ7_ABRPR|nr:transcription repressor OFP14 [Abrus precatorius]
MPKKFQDYLFKIKNPRPQIRLPFNSISSPKNWVLSGCKHPRTPSFALYNRNDADHGNNNNRHNDDAATLADIDRFLFENFKSLYLKDDEQTENIHNTKRVSEDQNHAEEEAPTLGSLLFESPRLVETPRDLCSSTRFFVKTGFSGSLVEDALTTMTNTSEEAGSISTTTSTATLNNVSSLSSSDSKEATEHTLPDNSIALLTYSPSPYEDFKRSMQEMVEARSRNNLINWDFMEELLFCYLNLNDKKSHKFILGAFVDLITSMRSNSDAVPAKPRSVRTVRTVPELWNENKEVTLEFGSS